jgi:hypothetical protein
MILIRGTYQFYMLRKHIFPRGVSGHDVNVTLFANGDRLLTNLTHDTALNLEKNIPFLFYLFICLFILFYFIIFLFFEMYDPCLQSYIL